MFSREHGRVGLVARGARSARSPWRGLGEPFVPLESEWRRRGELGTLTRLDQAGPRPRLAGRALWCALYANELVLVLTGRDEPLPELFDAYQTLLGRLAEATTLSTPLRTFELTLLESLGVVPDFQHEARTGEPISAEGWYRLEPETGFVGCVPGGRHVHSGAAILALAGGLLNEADDQRQAKLITRYLLDHQLNGRVLKTRELFRSMS
jgi:DNA repair protein RecO (recombination protein O)